jgi:hypothetical protein
VKTRIYVYTITRILSSVNGSRKVDDLLATGISSDNLRNLERFYKGLLEINIDRFKDFSDVKMLVVERVEFLENCIEKKN